MHVGWELDRAQKARLALKPNMFPWDPAVCRSAPGGV